MSEQKPIFALKSSAQPIKGAKFVVQLFFKKLSFSNFLWAFDGQQGCFSKATFKLFLLPFFIILAACTHESTNDFRVTKESEVTLESTSPVKTKGLFGESSQIKSLLYDKNQKVKALEWIEEILFVRLVRKPEITNDQGFSEILDLYVNLFEKWKQIKIQDDFHHRLASSLLTFKRKFVDPCAKQSGKSCRYFRSVLSKSYKVEKIIRYYVDQETNFQKKLYLTYVGMDIYPSQKSRFFEDVYIKMMLKIYHDRSLVEFSRDEFKQSFDEMTRIIKDRSLQNNLEESIFLYKELTPWVTFKSNDELTGLRNHLLLYLRQVIELDKDVLEQVEAEVESMASLIDSSFLVSYPAFRGIQVKPLPFKSPLQAFVSLKLYLTDLSFTTIMNLMKNSGLKREDLLVTYRWLKEMVKFDIAKNSIRSAKTLSARLAENKHKDSEFIESILFQGNDLQSVWAKLHQEKLPKLRRFLDWANKYYALEREKDIKNFYQSINRNILKTSIHPNMLAFLYKMVKSSFVEKIERPFGEISIDISKRVNQILSGNDSSIWFHFVDQNKLNKAQFKRPINLDSLGSKESLLMGEVEDSFYYFLTTNLYQVYDIDPSDFIQTLFTSAMKKKADDMRLAIGKQKSLYRKESSLQNSFVKWCESLKKKESRFESIPFYDLSSQITPFSKSLLNEDGDKLNVYYHDKYKYPEILTERRLDIVFIRELNDRARLEMRPLLGSYQRYLNILSRFKNKENLRSIDMTGVYKKYDFYRNLEKMYWGSQIQATELIADCDFEALKESRRRSQKVAFYEKKYFEQLVVPLLKEMKEGSRSLKSANEVIRSFHQKGGENLLEDHFTKKNGIFGYRSTWFGFMLRTRQYLTHGFQFDSSQHDSLLKPMILSPIVGPHLLIDLDESEVQNTQTNPYTNERTARGESFYFEEGVDETKFVNNYINLIMDTFEETQQQEEALYTKWQVEDESKYEIGFKKVEFFIQRLLMGEFKYFDYNGVGCVDNPNQNFSERCVKDNNFKPENLTKALNEVFLKTELKSDDLNYLSLIDEEDYLTVNNLSIQLKFDPSQIASFDVSSANDIDSFQLPFSNVSGFFDLALDMIKSYFLGSLYEVEFKQRKDASRRDEAVVNYGFSGCEDTRLNCSWGNELIAAKSFVIARNHRPGALFPYDTEILDETYSEIKQRLDIKLKYFEWIRKKGQDQLLAIRKKDLTYKVSRYKESFRLEPVSEGFKTYETQYKKAIKQATEGFFEDKQKESWSYYLIQ